MNIDYFNMWFTDKQCMLNCMIRNMQADLNCGYDYFGNSITKQRKEIEQYKANFDRQLDNFINMTEQQVNRWCKYDMLKRGVIEI